MSTGTNKSLALTKSDIAELASVGRSTVSNWISRHDDFPKPLPDEGPGERFDEKQIRQWLKKHGKAVTGLPGESVLFNIMDQLRGLADIGEIAQVLNAILVWRYISDSKSSGFDNYIDHKYRWTSLLSEDNGTGLLDALAHGMAAYEKSHAHLEHLFSPVTDQFEELETSRREKEMVEKLVLAVDELDPDELAKIYEALQNRVTASLWRGYDFAITGAFLVDLLAEVARNCPGPVHDPAAGSSRLLVATGERGSGRTRITGQEINPAARTRGLQRAIINGWSNVAIPLGDVFSMSDPWENLQAQVVVLDPPYSMTVPNADRLGIHPRLPYGPPPRSRADVGWLQLAISYLGPNGRAFVIQPPGTTYQGGAVKKVREAMLRDEVVEAVVSLPGGLASRTSIPLDLWVLARPGEIANPDEILLVDLTEFHVKDLDAPEIARALDKWRDKQEIPSEMPAIAVEIADVLADDGQVTPSRWIATHDLPSLEEVASKFDAVSAGIADLSGIALFDKAALQQLGQQLRMISVTELESSQVLEVLRAAKSLKRDEIGESGEPIVSPTWLRGDTCIDRVERSLLDERHVKTKPGDVVVRVIGNLEARVDHDGGRYLVNTGYLILRPDLEVIDPNFLAEALVTRTNSAMAQGAGIQRIRPQDLNVPYLGIAEQKKLAVRITQVRSVVRSARELASVANALRDDLVEALMAGEITIADKT